MAERRMFTMKIVDSDAFLEMPLSSQALYFHLNMRADDDGFVNNPKKIARLIGASDDDLKLLIAKRFIIVFESGVVVIKHWRMHNILRKDRYHETQYDEEKSMLEIKKNGSYTERNKKLATTWQPNGNQLATTWQPDGNHLATEDRIGKDRIGKDSVAEVDTPDIPTLEEVVEYCKEKNLVISPDYYYNKMEANEWCRYDKRLKKNVPVTNWKNSILNWDRTERNNRPQEKLVKGKDDWSTFLEKNDE